MLESPATDPGRAAEETIRAEIIAALNAAFRGFSFPGGRWSTGYGAEMAADALLSGPLAPILQEAAQLRARLHEAEKGAEAMRGRCMEVVQAVYDGWDRFNPEEKWARVALSNAMAQIRQIPPQIKEAGDGR